MSSSHLTPYEFGDVVILPFPFTNQVASKKRPAVIVSNVTYNRVKPDIVVMAIVRQLGRLGAADQVALHQTITEVLG